MADYLFRAAGSGDLRLLFAGRQSFRSGFQCTLMCSPVALSTPVSCYEGRGANLDPKTCHLTDVLVVFFRP
jgi:hypothetical protein